MAKKLRQQITLPIQLSNRYQAPAKQLYEWLIAPLEADLQAQGIQNIGFIMDVGLRSVPLAALYDGQKFIIERYSVGLMPSLSLTDTNYRDLNGTYIMSGRLP